MNGSNLQLQGLYLTVAAINNALESKGVLSREEVAAATGVPFDSGPTRAEHHLSIRDEAEQHRCLPGATVHAGFMPALRRPTLLSIVLALATATILELGRGSTNVMSAAVTMAAGRYGNSLCGGVVRC